MKKLILTLGIIIAVVMTGISTVQAATSTAELTASNTTVKPGDTFTVTLSASSEGGVALISGTEENDGFKVNYDSSKLELVSKEAKGFVDLNEEATSGTICLLGSSVSFKSGDVYVLTFKAKSDTTGDAQISTTSLIITDFDDEETTIDGKSVTVEIKDDSDTPSTPDTPDTPETPDTPDTPETPDTPSTPDTPETPDTPSKPDTPDTPKNPGTTSTTGKSGDSTTAASAGKIIPAAGSVAVKGLLIAGIATVSVIAYKKFNQLKDIK